MLQRFSLIKIIKVYYIFLQKIEIVGGRGRSNCSDLRIGTGGAFLLVCDACYFCTAVFGPTHQTTTYHEIDLQ